MRQRIDPERLCVLWAAGWTKQRIADEFGVTLAAVKDRVRRLALPPRYKGWHPAGYSEQMSRIMKERFRRRPRERRKT